MATTSYWPGSSLRARRCSSRAKMPLPSRARRMGGIVLFLHHGLGLWVLVFGAPDLGSAVDEQDAVEVVDLVLEDARQPIAGLDLDGLAFAVEGFDGDGFVAQDVAGIARQRQAALGPIHHLLPAGHDLGLDDDVQLLLGLE